MIAHPTRRRGARIRLAGTIRGRLGTVGLPVQPRHRPVLRIATGVHGEWSRRREAAKRLPPLDCGCRDPWPCRCYRPTVESDHQIDGWAAAARHLALNGLLPMLPVEAMRALWRRGGDDRALVVSIRIGMGERP